jgi:hypothetical protein
MRQELPLWPFVGSFDLARTRYSDPADSIAVDDIRMIRKLRTTWQGNFLAVST